MATRELQIEEIKVQMNSVEDVVFAQFCQEIGIRNIRQYEDRHLREQEERKQKRLEFEKQINRITSNLEFEKSRDTQSKYLFFCYATSILCFNACFGLINYVQYNFLCDSVCECVSLFCVQNVLLCV